MFTSRLLWTLLLLCAAIVLACLIVPPYVMQPFRAQDARALDWALWVRRWSPLFAALAAVGSLAIAQVLWRRGASRVSVIAVSILIVGIAALSRINIFERMFHPVDTPSFATTQAALVDADDFVLGVRLNGAARAYPIRTMGYHHVVNDAVGGVPIVTTY